MAVACVSTGAKMKEFHLQIVTPDGIEFDGMAESLLVKCETGDVEILAGHTDLFASVYIGRARIKTRDGSKTASCAGGFLSVSAGDVRLVNTTFEFAEDIDIERAYASKEKATLAIERAESERALILAKAKLSRALNRIRVAGDKR